MTLCNGLVSDLKPAAFIPAAHVPQEGAWGSRRRNRIVCGQRRRGRRLQLRSVRAIDLRGSQRRERRRRSLRLRRNRGFLQGRRRRSRDYGAKVPRLARTFQRRGKARDPRLLHGPGQRRRRHLRRRIRSLRLCSAVVGDNARSLGCSTHRRGRADSPAIPVGGAVPHRRHDRHQRKNIDDPARGARAPSSWSIGAGGDDPRLPLR